MMLIDVQFQVQADKYGVYLWTPRFVLHMMWPLRFWEWGRQKLSDTRGNVSPGPVYLAWYDRAAWEK